MDERALLALKGSIEKWEKIVSGEGVDKGVDNCPLCHEFHSIKEVGACQIVYCTDCPVWKKTGEVDCFRTPYSQWIAVQKRHNRHRDYKADFPEAVEAAMRELEFLQSLLPKTGAEK